MKTFGLQVHDRARRAGGRQCIESPDGYFMPLNVINNLVYSSIRAFSDKDWTTLRASAHYGGHEGIQQSRLRDDRC